MADQLYFVTQILFTKKQKTWWLSNLPPVLVLWVRLRIDPLCFLAGCRKRRLNQAPLNLHGLIWLMMMIWRKRENINTAALVIILLCNTRQLIGPADCHIGTLSCARRLPTVYCIIVEWFWWHLSLSQWPTGFLQCFDAVGWVIWPVKIVSKMTYKVLSGTLSLYTLTCHD